LINEKMIGFDPQATFLFLVMFMWVHKTLQTLAEESDVM